MAFTSLASALQSRPKIFSALTVLIRLLVMAACAMLAWGAWLPAMAVARTCLS